MVQCHRIASISSVQASDCSLQTASLSLSRGSVRNIDESWRCIQSQRYVLRVAEMLSKLSPYQENRSVNLFQHWQPPVRGQSCTWAWHYLNRCKEIHPSHVRCLLSMSKCSLKLNNLNDARDICQQILKLDPRCAQAHENLAAADQKQDTKSAINHLKKAIAIKYTPKRALSRSIAYSAKMGFIAIHMN